MIVSDWQVSIGTTLYISSTAQHFSYSTQLHTQLNYGGTSGIHHHQTSSKITGYQWILVHPQPKRQRGGVLLEMYQQTVQGKSCYTIEEDELISVNSLHDHEPNHVEVAGNKVVQEMKTRARSETTLIPKIYAQTLRTVGDDEEVAATLPTLNSIRISLYQSRRQRYPSMPESEDLDFTGEWAVTDKNETLMQVLSH